MEAPGTAPGSGDASRKDVYVRRLLFSHNSQSQPANVADTEWATTVFLRLSGAPVANDGTKARDTALVPPGHCSGSESGSAVEGAI